MSFIKHINKKQSNQKARTLYETANEYMYTKSLLGNYVQLQQYLSIVKPSFSVTQFLSNHGYHKEYLHRFKITSEPYCPCDNTPIQSTQHLIKHCSCFVDTRNTHLTAANILNIDPYNIIEIISNETTIVTFHSHVYKIIKTHKYFNKQKSI